MSEPEQQPEQREPSPVIARDVRHRLAPLRNVKVDRARIAELVAGMVLPAINPLTMQHDERRMEPAGLVLLERMCLVAMGRLRVTKEEMRAMRIAMSYTLGLPRQQLDVALGGGAAGVYALIAESRRQSMADRVAMAPLVTEALPSDLADRARRAGDNGVH